jgi:hypothetical protein
MANERAFLRAPPIAQGLIEQLAVDLPVWGGPA